MTIPDQVAQLTRQFAKSIEQLMPNFFESVLKLVKQVPDIQGTLHGETEKSRQHAGELEALKADLAQRAVTGEAVSGTTPPELP